MPSTPSDTWLRHTIATLAYRAEKALREAPPGFSGVRASPHSRSALGLVAHLGDLMEWGERMARGEMRWQAVPQSSWHDAIDRFFHALAAFDAAVADSPYDPRRHEILFQGPVADALSHVGQLTLMRGIAGSPVRPESYARARITTGRVGRDQDSVRTEFDGDASPQDL